jgi:hypothetical protein
MAALARQYSIRIFGNLVIDAHTFFQSTLNGEAQDSGITADLLLVTPSGLHLEKTWVQLHFAGKSRAGLFIG